VRVLIVRTGALGDVLHALPAVAALHRAQPAWEIDWAVDPRWASLLVDGEGRGPVVSRIVLAETKLWSQAPLSLATLQSLRGLRTTLRAESYDLVVDMQGTLRSAFIGRMAGAARLVGYSDPRERAAGWLYSQRVARSQPHVVEQGAALLADACGIALEPAVVELPREPWADQWAAELVAERKVCVLAPGAGWGAKRWPPPRFGEVAQALRALGFTCLVNASRKDDALASEVVAASHGAAEMTVCNIAGLIALLRRSSLLVGGDSGPLHLAAALGVPVVALFGPTDPARNGPWGPGAKAVLRDAAALTSYKRSAEPDAGMARLTVQQVIDAVRGLTSRQI